MPKQVSIRIFPDGHIQAEIHGIKGKKCTDYIKVLEELLEAETIDSDYLPEYFETEVVSQNEEVDQKVKGGA